MMFKLMHFTRLICFCLITLFVVSIASATTIELVNPDELSGQLNEGDYVEFTLKIKDYEDVSSIKLETNLETIGNEPLYDFGNLNEQITGNKYDQTMILTDSDLPQMAFLEVTISGKVPNGEIRDPYGDNLVLIKFKKTNLKYYEVKTDDKTDGIETFELQIKRQIDFENTMDKVELEELNALKKETRELYDNGLVMEAEDFANEMSKIKLPNNLRFLEIIEIRSNLMLNLMVIGSSILFLIFGFIIGLYYVSSGDKYDV